MGWRLLAVVVCFAFDAEKEQTDEAALQLRHISLAHVYNVYICHRPVSLR